MFNLVGNRAILRQLSCYMNYLYLQNGYPTESLLLLKNDIILRATQCGEIKKVTAGVIRQAVRHPLHYFCLK